MFTRLLYFGRAVLHMSQEETELTALGEMLDMYECDCQRRRVSRPYIKHYIDDIIPDRVK